MDEKQVIKDFVKRLDDLTPFDKWIGGIGGAVAEAADRAIYSIAVNKGYDALPDGFKPKALEIMEAVINKEYMSIADTGVDVLVEKINTSFGDEKERIVLGGLLNIAKQLLEAEEVSPQGSGVGQGPPDQDPD